MKRWPSLLEKPTARGRIREQVEDFVVQEIPAYDPCGEGKHLFIEVEKTGLTSDQVVAALATQLNISERDIGMAGIKDRWAITRQWFSLPAQAEDVLDKFQLEGVRILSRKAHGNKLKTGHLNGNTFQIRVRGLDHDSRKDIEDRVAKILRLGIPNYFGTQRFGSRGDNENLGKLILDGRGPRLSRRRLRLVLNAVQSALFNDVLAQRIQGQSFNLALAGDLMIKTESGGRFVCEDPSIDQARMDAHEIHPSGPMFGPRMRRPEGQVDEQEQSILEASGLDDASWRRFAKLTQGTRRALRIGLGRLDTEWTEGDLILRFDLPPGSYATVVLQELLVLEEPTKSAPPD
ncbi:MAG: tRNA pseudouridine(13) synthase TruD [Deltaproteobacteria bacterium]|nr:tRNA pseudouridine(13) synthase TruD [Deltaproteobacteria bacterium]